MDVSNLVFFSVLSFWGARESLREAASEQVDGGSVFVEIKGMCYLRSRRGEGGTGGGMMSAGRGGGLYTGCCLNGTERIGPTNLGYENPVVPVLFSKKASGCRLFVKLWLPVLRQKLPKFHPKAPKSRFL